MMGRRRIPRGVKAGPGTYFGGPPRILWDRYGSKLTIGSWTAIGRDVAIFLGGQHKMDRVSVGMPDKWSTFSKGDVAIGSDVWIGHGAVIMDGVMIGDGAVVGAFSVVAKDVEPFSVVVGNPARKIRSRFSTDVVEALLRIRWWDWPVDEVMKHRGLIRSSDLKEFIRRFG